MLDQIVVVDTETCGLDPVEHPVWEVAAIDAATGDESHWFLPIDVGRVSDWVRTNTGFAQRYDLNDLTPLHQFCAEFAEFADGRHLAGNVVSFDTERLARIYRHVTASPDVPWHYHTIDCETLIVGHLAANGYNLTLPWSSRQLSEAAGVPVPDGLHDAMVDARWARDELLAVLDRC